MLKKQAKNNSRIRIGIDCRLSGSAHAGIGRYIENLILRLPQIAPEFEWVYFFHDLSQWQELLHTAHPKQRLGLKKVTVRYVPIRHYTLAEQLRLPGIFTQEKLDLLHVPHFNAPLLNRVPTVVTIHDLLWHEYRGNTVTTLPPWVYWLKYIGYKKVVSQAVQQAVKVIVPTETIKRTLLQQYPKLQSKIVVTHEGVDQRLLSSQQLTTLPKKARQSLLYVGSLYPHKNIRLVIDALQQLHAYELIIVGSRNVFQKEVETYSQKQGVANRVIFTGYLSDQALNKLFQQVTALVQPSLSEGFGLTGVEAMAAGIPVLASRIPIFEEIYQEASIYFDPHSVNSFVSAVQKLAKSNRQSIINKGKKVAARYSWDTMTIQTVAAYRSALGFSVQ